MTTLTVTSAQSSEAGVKPANDDACGVRVPEAELLTTKGVAAVIAEGKSVTYDMKPARDDPSAVGTSQVADAVMEKLR